ncbi:unnamed protein product [Pieris macdunnoughi]|uniref:Uncharacterized protein n=1 Tax=Pieris macdunnoughi TaxID=345717 RepID=A0A821X8F9_9NEOP|nr:unnamed protein product [Pieris macdunnoughi]
MTKFNESDRCRIPNECIKKHSIVCNVKDETRRSIIARVRMDVYSESKPAAYLKFKCARVPREFVNCRRTMAMHVRALAVLGLVFMLVTTVQGAPGRKRPSRSAHEKNAVSYL